MVAPPGARVHAVPAGEWDSIAWNTRFRRRGAYLESRGTPPRVT
jgi:hypothetical protein